MQVRIPVFSASFFPVCRISEFSWLYITKKYFFVVYEVTELFNLMQPSGVYQGVLALSRMSFVDTEKIGITGHSMGSWSCNAAVASDNEAETQLISSVLIHCNEPTYTDADGNYANIYGSRDVGVISAVYDEFFGKSTAEDEENLQQRMVPAWIPRIMWSLTMHSLS